MKKIITFFTVLLISSVIYANTTLGAGDIAFVGVNFDGVDDYSFILLKDIDATTTITFTDKGWTGSAFSNNTGEATWTWTSGTALTTGTVITITGTSLATSTGSVSGGTPTLSSIGDQIFAFQGSEASPTFIAGVHSNVSSSTDANWDGVSSSNSTSALPSALTNGTNAIRLHNSESESDNWQYNCAVVSGDVTTVRAAINNVANWTTDNITAYTPAAPTCSWNITAPIACIEPDVPTVTYTPTTVCNGGTASLNISGDLNDATVWNVYTGSCGGTLIGSTTTGSFAIPDTISSTTDYFVRGEGDCATLGSCGSATVTVTPNEDAAFFYGSTSYCMDASDPSAILFPGTTTGGSFSSTMGLSLASATGTIDLSDSTAGTYTITYTTSGTCFDTATYDITINALDNASFLYGMSSYTTNDSDPTPTITGLAGGVFSATPVGLSINASSGVIDVSNSTPGINYTITYTTLGSCPNSTDTPVSITSSVITWTGTINNDWNTLSNWDTNTLPTSSSDVIIPNGLTNYPTSNVGVTFNSMVINSGATFIPNSTVIGPVTYKRNLPTTNWYLVASPVNGETQQDVIANHTFANGTGSNIGIGIYDQNSADSPWLYATAASTGFLPIGVGISMKLAAPGDVSITGDVIPNNIAYPISQGTRTNFNLLGNPYTAYMNSATFTTTNTSLLTEETVWLWDGTSYVTYNAMNPIEIAPAQGYFVEASTNNNVLYQTTNRSHQNSDTFMRQTPTDNFELSITNNDATSSTKVFYVDGKTTGFDNGYDSKMFGGTTTDFAVYTNLVTENTGKKLAIQTLPTDNTTAIPVGLIAKAGEEITFSVENLNLPEGTDVFLEDKTNNEFVNLSKTTYKTTLTEDINTTGRFYIHTSAKSLNTLDIVENNNNISIYKSSKQTITVTGLNGVGKINIYSLLGKEVLNTPLSSNGSSIVNLPSLSAGVYMVKLTSDGISKSTKITLN